MQHGAAEHNARLLGEALLVAESSERSPRVHMRWVQPQRALQQPPRRIEVPAARLKLCKGMQRRLMLGVVCEALLQELNCPRLRATVSLTERPRLPGGGVLRVNLHPVRLLSQWCV